MMETNKEESMKEMNVKCIERETALLLDKIQVVLSPKKVDGLLRQQQW